MINNNSAADCSIAFKFGMIPQTVGPFNVLLCSTAGLFAWYLSYLPERTQKHSIILTQRTHTKELLNKTTELNYRDFP